MAARRHPAHPVGRAKAIERNSLSGKRIAPHVREDMCTSQLISEKPSRVCSAKGNPEGSLRDPVTTDPKGEARESYFNDNCAIR